MHTSPDVTAYIESQEPQIQERLRAIRSLFHEHVPNTQEKISYGIPCFSVGTEHLYVSSCKNHIGLYPMYGLEELENELAPFRGKGTKDALHFPHDQAIPFALIGKIIKAKEKKTS